MRWYYQDPVNSVLHDPALHAAVVQTFRLAVYVSLITVPLGVALAADQPLGRHTASTFNFVMILSFVIPELIFGVAMFFVFTRLFTVVGLGTLAEVLALVTWNVSWPDLIVQARLVTIGRQYEEAAADLGAAPCRSLTGSCCPCSPRPSSPAPFWSSLASSTTSCSSTCSVPPPAIRRCRCTSTPSSTAAMAAPR